ncbi:unnamed protein product [Brassica rapa]|uniref:Uncharacterized protein n=1 Tax=Brassica campestris TaxID=3711 RepID=A0A8D9DEG5_BRACM|nr:unnamed protein product [Brassica rapa]
MAHMRLIFSCIKNINDEGNITVFGRLYIFNEKQPLMDLEQGIKLTSFTDNEPPKMILDKTNITGSGYVTKWSEGSRGPWDAPYQIATLGEVEESQKQKAIEDPTMENVTGTDNVEYCCIYRVPNWLRRVNPEAYTPQMLLLGPLQHSKKAEALELSKTDLRYMNYMNMERHKKKYLMEIAHRYGTETIIEFSRIIERDEHIIRASYAESTEWIKSAEFVEMIIRDAVFLLGFFLQTGTQKYQRNEDILFDVPCHITRILEDLILLENQLPYALLENLFEPFLFQFRFEETLRDIILRVFRFEGKLKKDVKFRHFTDLFRRVRVATLGLPEEQAARAEQSKFIKSLYNADKLDSAGVEFANVGEENDLSLVIVFKGGVLTMPCFTVEENTERVMRNMMALEQCHYPLSAYVCNYITFLDFLIYTDADVDLLVKKDVIKKNKNWLGHQGSVAEMVNKLCLGLVDFGSYYEPIAEKLKKHYNSSLHRSVATLRRVYFKDIWTGTATVAAVVLLILALVQTVASVLQVTQSDPKSPPPQAPPRGKHLEYEKMEQHKKKYLENFALMYGNQTVEEFIRIIVRDEQITGRRYIDKTGYFLFDESCHRDTIFKDLLLLENQLPFSLLENLFGPFFIKFGDNLTFRDFILGNFGFINKIKPEVNFIHITDMFRCVRVEKLGLTKKDQIYEQYSKKFLIKNLHNADELDSAGVDIVGNKVERGTSFAIKFERGVLTMPCFTARGHTERLWRNIMALEQCHYTYAAYVCHYIAFLDFLIDTEQDVELLVNKAERLNKYYDNRLNRSLATLRRVYFKDLWTGTATIAAVIILVLTLIGTVTSVLQVTQDDSDPTKSLLPPPPSRDL